MAGASLDVRGPVLLALVECVLGSSSGGSSSGGSNSSGGSSSGGSSISGDATVKVKVIGSGSGSMGIANDAVLSVVCRLLVDYDRDVDKGSEKGLETGSDKSNDDKAGSGPLLARYQEAALHHLQADPVKHTDKFMTG